ncbi:hypothetical protein MKW92_027707 [Papaver armeniacum]|nr:hypothetical protein MKW92_027707 [Papaver armeniacum]
MSSSLFSALVVFLMLCNSIPQIQSVKEEDNISLIRLPSEEEVGLCTKLFDYLLPTRDMLTYRGVNFVVLIVRVTYWCGCADAYCAGTQVAKLGFCEVGANNGGGGNAGPVSGQAPLLVHIFWLILLGFSLLFGLF